MNKARILLLALLGCTEHLPGVTGTQSIQVELVSPADPGSVDNRLTDDAREIQVRLTALDEQGEVDESFSAEVQMYAQFLATLTPELGHAPLAKAMLTAGQSGVVTVQLPPVFGKTVLWVEDSAREDATFVVGTSPGLWFRDPFIADISTPPDEDALNALSSSPLEGKQVTVSSSRYGANGRLLVTSTYAQGYTVSDANCASSPCTTGAYDHMLVFTFSRPRDDEGRSIEVGQAISGFGGGVTEFNGLTELSFPRTIVMGEPDVRPERLPAPSVVQLSWFTNPIEFEKAESGLIEVQDGVVCPLDDAWTTYKQWRLAVGGADCASDNVVNVISTGITEINPEALVGQTVSRTVGSLRPVNLASFNVWIMFPRSAADVEL